MKRPPRRWASNVWRFQIDRHRALNGEHYKKKRWFRQAQAWRTGCEGRISVLKRRHGLNRCRYRGDDGMKRWVGLGVIADNLINIGKVLALQAAEVEKFEKKRIGPNQRTRVR